MKKLKASAEQITARVLDAQIKLMDPAVKSVLAIVPSSEIEMHDYRDDNRTVLMARGLPMYAVKTNMCALPDITVTGGWLNWPPPEATIESALLKF